MDRTEFEGLVADALDGLPDEIVEMMSNVEVVVEDEPPPWEQARLGPGRTLLGLYQGIPLTGRGPYYDHVLPDKISIFMGPIVRTARTPAGIKDQVRRTVIHEIAHHFGIEEGRLHELGWG